MALAKQFRISVTIQPLDEEGNPQPVGMKPFTETWDVDAHNVRDFTIAASGNIASIPTGAITGSVATPSAIVVYEPNTPVTVQPITNYPACNLFIACRFDGGDLTTDAVTLTNTSSTLAVYPLVLSSGDFA